MNKFTHQNYTDTINGLSKKQIEERDKKVKEAGITSMDLGFDGPKKSWSGTLVFKDSVPVSLSWYDYDAGESVVTKDLCKVLGRKVKLGFGGGGNGHNWNVVELVDEGKRS